MAILEVGAAGLAEVTLGGVVAAAGIGAAACVAPVAAVGALVTWGWYRDRLKQIEGIMWDVVNEFPAKWMIRDYRFVWETVASS